MGRPRTGTGQGGMATRTSTPVLSTEHESSSIGSTQTRACSTSPMRTLSGGGGSMARSAVANEEWEQILKRPWREIREILLEESDEGQRLRSTHPFRGIVTEEKRLEIMRRHPTPWPYKPYATESAPPEVMEKILSEGIPERIDGPGSSQRRKPA